MESLLAELLGIMARLRNPENGCAWDCKQNFKTIAPYTLEEAYEVADAIEREDYESLREELGDLLLQVVYHAQMAAEQNLFDINDVMRGISDKMIERHPHVFNTSAADNSTHAQAAQGTQGHWEDSKEQERVQSGHNSVLAGIARNLPQLNLAYKLQSRAARVGFDWRDSAQVLAKLNEELEEFHDAVKRAAKDNIEEELGDLLFTIVNLSRHYSVNPETALRIANRKFEKRFCRIEEELEGQGGIKNADSSEMERAWKAAKAEE